MSDTQQDVIIIGGGPSGMIAAVEAARRGRRVAMLERNEKLGRKLYITGKGRCNLTNASEREQLIRNTVRNGKFLYSAFSAFGSKQLMDYVESLGVPLVVERGSRVFPASGKSSDIIRAFQMEMMRLGVKIIFHTRVSELVVDEGVLTAVRAEDGREFRCRSAVLATGGLSYPSTGSTGDGYRMATALGHTVIPPQPSLVPIDIQDAWVPGLQGLSLKNVRLTAMQGGRKLSSEIGEMLFTHAGISGPLVLTASSLLDNNEITQSMLSLDMKPGLEPDALDARILRDFQGNSNRALKNSLFELLPSRLCPVVIQLAELDGELPVNGITKVQRERLGAVIKSIPMSPLALRTIDEAVITRGGIACTEVNPKTMESKVVQGLFIGGEVLDVDALTGGFNLQIAFSTGFAAGNNC